MASGPVHATVVVPGSKSITNRALLVAAVAEGTSVLTGAQESDDALDMAGALNALGVPVSHDAEASTFRVQGGGGTFAVPEADLFVGNSGTTMRFLTAALPLRQGCYR